MSINFLFDIPDSSAVPLAKLPICLCYSYIVSSFAKQSVFSIELGEFIIILVLCLVLSMSCPAFVTLLVTLKFSLEAAPDISFSIPNWEKIKIAGILFQIFFIFQGNFRKILHREEQHLWLLGNKQ